MPMARGFLPQHIFSALYLRRPACPGGRARLLSRIPAVFAALLWAFSAGAAQAVENATWAGEITGLEPEWNSALNWKGTSSVLGGVPTDTATFDGTAWWSKISVSYGSGVQIKTLHFTADAKNYSFSIGGVLMPATMTITGKGIVNDGAARPKFHVGGVLLGKGTLCFTNEATAGHAALSSNSKGKICFADKAKAGDATIQMEEDSTLEFSGESSADNAQIDMAKGSEAIFKDNAGAGDSHIKVSEKARVGFEDKASAGKAVIDVSNGGAADFSGNTTAGSATLNIEEGGKSSFSGNASADHAHINVEKGGSVGFSGNASSDEAQVNVKDGGSARFDDKANAGKSKITVADNGKLDFKKETSAGQSDITVKKDGKTAFYDNSSAGSAELKAIDGGEIGFSGNATADKSKIIADAGGSVDFSGNSTAGTSNMEIKNGGAAGFHGSAAAGNAKLVVTEGGKAGFDGNSTAGEAKLIADKNGTIDFSGKASGGKALIDVSNGGKAKFGESSDAGSATINSKAGGAVDFGGKSSAGNATVNVSQGGKAGFGGNATAGNAKLNVTDKGEIVFKDNAGAGKATLDIKNGGKAGFAGNATAGEAKITAANGGEANFSGNSSAGKAVIDVKEGGKIGLSGNADAGEAQIAVDKGGALNFDGNAKGGKAVIDVKEGGKAGFGGSSDAGEAKISVGKDGAINFDGNAKGGKAVIDVKEGGKAGFGGNATAGEADIALGKDSALSFKDHAQGGKAAVTMAEGSALDISGLTSGRMDIGSVSGAGNIALGGNTLGLGGNGRDSDFAGKISGSGGLGKVGNGTLTLSGENDFAGGVQIDGGSVDARNTKALGTGDVTIANGSNLNLGASGDYPNTIKIGAGGSGTLSAAEGVEANPKGIMVGDGGSLNFGKPGEKNGGTIAINGADSSFGKNSAISVNGGGLKLGDEAAGKLFDQPGSTLNISKDGAVDLNGNALSVNNLTGSGKISSSAPGDVSVNIKSGDFGGKISDGAGKVGVHKTGDGVLRLSGDNDYSGPTQVEGGELQLQGNLKNSDVTVGKGATMSGAGTIHALHAQSGSTICPGGDGKNGKPGKLAVMGDTVFDKGSNLIIKQGKGGSSDQVFIQGNANIKGGNVATKGMLRPGDVLHNIVSSSGALTGGFDGIEPEFTTNFIKPVFEKTANGISIKFIRNGVTLDKVGRSGNEAGLGRALESLPMSNNLMVHVLNSTAAEAQEAMKRLSGEVYASTRSAILQSSNYLPSFMKDRMIEQENGKTAAAAGGNAAAPMAQMVGYPSFGGAGNAYAGGKNSLARLPAGNYAFGRGELWVRGFSSRLDSGKSGNGAYGHEMNTTGSFAGLDARLGQWQLGGAFGLGYSDFNNKELVNYGHMRTLYSGLYGGRQYKGLNIRLGGQQNWHEIHTRRSVEFTRYSDFLKSKYHARLTQIFGEAGLPLDFSKGRIEPFAGLAYNYLHNGKMRERGGDAALSGSAGSYDYVAGTLGLRGQMLFYDAAGRRAALRAMLGWQHSFGSMAQTAGLSFAQSQAFDTKGTPLARDALAAEAGMDFRFSDKAALGVSYNYQYGQKNRDYGVRINFRTQY